MLVSCVFFLLFFGRPIEDDAEVPDGVDAGVDAGVDEESGKAAWFTTPFLFPKNCTMAYRWLSNSVSTVLIPSLTFHSFIFSLQGWPIFKYWSLIIWRCSIVRRSVIFRDTAPTITRWRSGCANCCTNLDLFPVVDRPSFLHCALSSGIVGMIHSTRSLGL